MGVLKLQTTLQCKPRFTYARLARHNYQVPALQSGSNLLDLFLSKMEGGIEASSQLVLAVEGDKFIS